jgi:hypothetical protein
MCNDRRMPKTHVVAQGEHISSIAERYRFISTDTIWMHPDNAGLRALRSSPNILHERDEIVRLFRRICGRVGELALVSRGYGVLAPCQGRSLRSRRRAARYASP